MARNNLRTKKVILFLVEGITDKISLGLILSKIVTTESIHFGITDGDICYKDFVDCTNAINKVSEYVKYFIKRNSFKKTDIIQIVHLIDTDGAFVPDSNVIHNVNVEIEYFNDRIETSKLAATLSRMKNKTEIMKKLSTISAISGISYSVYFFSRNLEHVLHNISCRLSREEKNQLSDKFEDLYADSPHKFVDFIKSPTFAVLGTYHETWRFIMQETNSLKRN